MGCRVWGQGGQGGQGRKLPTTNYQLPITNYPLPTPLLGIITIDPHKYVG
ncbi:hypothetical protein H6G17_13875 [Chroococcidiopsis sp. FACHB-1243]|nr:hypothetical protein [Chroococcidiopsis sp. [FACHB-1243]]MBD2306597.1 hypothetical protein [Chroococcidiopsis sp. [FACHB-1243]]